MKITFEPPEGECGFVLLQVAGVSFGDSVGSHDDWVAFEEGTFPIDGAFSPTHAASTDYAFAGWTGYLTFDPPVSEVSMKRCAFNQVNFTAWDSLGFVTVSESSPDLGVVTPCDSNEWTDESFSTSGYRISRLRLSSGGGVPTIDDLTFRREAPPLLECDTGAVRGQTGTCTIQGPAESVIVWRFSGQMPPNFQAVTVTDSSDTTEWGGKAVLSGMVKAEVIVDDDTLVYQDSLVVEPRSLTAAEWDWNSKWNYTEDGGLPCQEEYLPYHHPSPDTLAESTPTDNCDVKQIGPVMNDTLSFAATYATDSVQAGPNAGLTYVSEAYYRIDYGSYKNPHARPTAAGDLVISPDNLKDCRKHYGNVSSLTLNLHDYNLNCTKGQGPAEFTEWWEAVERHEGRGTPGKGPPNNGHHAQRELEAANPINDPYRVAESMVRNSSRDLRNFLFPPIDQAATRIADKAGDHNVVKQNFGSLDNQGEYCGDIWIYWTDVSPAAYYSTRFCDDI